MSDQATAMYGQAGEVANLLGGANHHVAEELVIPALINAMTRIQTLEKQA